MKSNILHRITGKAILSIEGDDFRGLDLSYSDLRGLNLENVNLEGAILNSANLEGANLKKKLICKMQKCVFQTLVIQIFIWVNLVT